MSKRDNSVVVVNEEDTTVDRLQPSGHQPRVRLGETTIVSDAVGLLEPAPLRSLLSSHCIVSIVGICHSVFYRSTPEGLQPDFDPNISHRIIYFMTDRKVSPNRNDEVSISVGVKPNKKKKT